MAGTSPAMTAREKNDHGKVTLITARSEERTHLDRFPCAPRARRRSASLQTVRSGKPVRLHWRSASSSTASAMAARRVGDRVTLPSDRGAIAIAGVVQVEHAAVRAEADARERKEPLATIFVQWIKEERR